MFLQIVSASLDEITLEFVKPDSTSYEFTGSILENYPRVPPLWFSASEDPVIEAVLNEMSSNNQTPGVLHQIHFLVSRLCELNQLTLPAELLQIVPVGFLLSLAFIQKSFQSQELDEGTGSDEDMADAQSENEDEEDVEMYDDMADDVAAFQDVASSVSTAENADELSPEANHVLHRVVQAQRQQHLRGVPAGSVSANDRLMKELRDIYKSENFKNGVYSIDLVKDNLYEWDMKLFKVDAESQLAADLKQLERDKKQNFLLFKFHFKDTFP